MSNDIKQHIRKYLYTSPKFMRLVLEHTAKTGKPLHYQGEVIDKYTANMILAVAKKLNTEHRVAFFKRPLNEMVALAYTLLTD
jgi:hypothetical protein